MWIPCTDTSIGWFCYFTIVPLILADKYYNIFRGWYCITGFSSNHLIHWIVFHRKYLRNIFLEILINLSQDNINSTWDVVYDRDWLYCTLHVWNNKTLLMMDLLNIYILFSCLIFELTFDKYVSGVSTILVNNEFCGWVSWYVELLLFSHFLLTKLTIILIIWS